MRRLADGHSQSRVARDLKIGRTKVNELARKITVPTRDAAAEIVQEVRAEIGQQIRAAVPARLVEETAESVASIGKKISEGFEKAVEYLKGVVDDPVAHPAIKVRAASTLATIHRDNRAEIDDEKADNRFEFVLAKPPKPEAGDAASRIAS